jgi:ribonuclease P/MRP protein subunit RPP40
VLSKCAKVVWKANKVLGMIRRTFKNFSSDVVIKLYKFLIRPRLEYAVQAWRPYLQKDIHLIEGVQRRATKLVVGTNGMSYEERLQFLDMTTLETRRVIGDLIEVFKILTGMEDVKKEQFFTTEKWCARDMNLNDLSLALTWTVGNMLFSNRVINMWNSLPSDVNACNTV